jgi:hypothetical protein
MASIMVRTYSMLLLCRIVCCPPRCDTLPRHGIFDVSCFPCHHCPVGNPLFFSCIVCQCCLSKVSRLCFIRSLCCFIVSTHAPDVVSAWMNSKSGTWGCQIPLGREEIWSCTRFIGSRLSQTVRNNEESVNFMFLIFSEDA